MNNGRAQVCGTQIAAVGGGVEPRAEWDVLWDQSSTPT